jgi:hypothetical protein
MGKKFYETLEFKEVSKEWEEILEKGGLPDIEKQLGEQRGLRQNSSNVYRQMDPVRRQAKELYFQQLGKCLHSACFDENVDRVVMVLRARGSKIIEICEALAKLDMARCRGIVRFIIRKYEHKWGIRNWKPHQLDYQWRKKPPTR